MGKWEDGLRLFQIRPVQNQRELEEMYHQRWFVLREPLGMLQGTEKDKYDPEAFHLITLENTSTDISQKQTIIGSARLREISPGIGSIAYVCVLSEFRNRGIGTKLIQGLIKVAQEKGLKSIRINARLSTIGFYQRLGFSTDGEPYDFLDVPHIFMNLGLSPTSN